MHVERRASDDPHVRGVISVGTYHDQLDGQASRSRVILPVQTQVPRRTTNRYTGRGSRWVTARWYDLPVKVRVGLHKPTAPDTNEVRNIYSISIHTTAIYNYRGENMYKIKREGNPVHACGIYVRSTRGKYERNLSLEYDPRRLVRAIRRNTLTHSQKMVCSKAPSPSPCTE